MSKKRKSPKKNPRKHRQHLNEIEPLLEVASLSNDLFESDLLITDEPFENKYPQKIQDHLHDLYEQVYTAPKKAIPQLEESIKIYPNVPQFYNYLMLAYSKIGNWDKANEVILQNYERHPDYLFAKTNYAKLCLHQSKVKQIPIIFDHHFDLKSLYPKRDIFHISEVIAFFGMLGEYYIKIELRPAAESCYQLLHQLDARHKQTRSLKRQLYPSMVSRFVRKLTARGRVSNETES